MIFKTVAVAIVGVLLISLLKNSTSAYSGFARVALVGVVVLSVIPQLGEIIEMLRNIEVGEYVSKEAIKIMFKMFAILAVGAVASDVCRDNGETAVANAVDLSVKLMAISCGLPVFMAVINVAISFLNG